MTRLILASASASRAKLLRGAGVTFEIEPADVDEDVLKASLGTGGGRVVADVLAERKACRISSSRPDALVLGADQVLVLDGTLVSKAHTLAAAREQLKALRGKRHALISALVLAKGGVPVWRHADEAQLCMRAFGDAFLEAYLAEEGEAVLGSVGCYRLEGMGAQLFDSVEGDYFSILGLPLVPLLAALRDRGAIGS